MDRIKGLRRHLGLTQAEMAARLGTRQQTISEWEKGMYRPRGASATLLSIVAGWMGAPGFLHPAKRALTPDMMRDADVTFKQIGAHREDFDVLAPDGVILRGWKVRPAQPNGAWVLVFHGVADNRYGMTEHARLLLMSGYSVVMMDSRVHGASGGEIATYGWLERTDTRQVIDMVESGERPAHLVLAHREERDEAEQRVRRPDHAVEAGLGEGEVLAEGARVLGREVRHLRLDRRRHRAQGHLRLARERFEPRRVEEGGGTGPFGAKGMGEGGTLAAAAAICNAVYDATGVRLYQVPLIGERVWTALEKSAGKRGA